MRPVGNVALHTNEAKFQMSSTRMLGAKRALNSADKKLGLQAERTAEAGDSQLLKILSDDCLRNILPRLTHSDLDKVSLLNRRFYQLTKESRPKSRLEPARKLAIYYDSAYIKVAIVEGETVELMSKNHRKYSTKCAYNYEEYRIAGNANVLAVLLNKHLHKNVPKTVKIMNLSLESNFEQLDELKQWIIRSKIEDLEVICRGVEKFFSINFLEEFANASENPSWSLIPSIIRHVPINAVRDAYIEYGTPIFAALSRYVNLTMDNVQVAPDRFMQLVELRFSRGKAGWWEFKLLGRQHLLTDSVVRNWNRQGTVIEQNGEDEWKIMENGREIIMLRITGASVLPIQIVSVHFHC